MGDESLCEAVGEVSPAVEVSVRVVDPHGAPVEGVPVRHRAEGEDTWSVAHNTDRGGIARFHAPPQSSSSFRVSDFPSDAPESRAPNLRVSGEVGAAPPSEPFTIRLTDRQIELVLRRSPSVDG